MTTTPRSILVTGAMLYALVLSDANASAAVFQVGGTGVSDCTFWCTDRLQQVYASSLFSGPVAVTRISFFASPFNGTAWDGIGTWQMTLSTSNNPVGALDGTFANNVGADVAVFDTLTPPAGTLPVNAQVSFLGSFIYNPSMGDLLIDIQRTAGTEVGVGMDAGFAPGQIDRAFSYDSTETALAVNQNGYALRTELETNPVPEPSALLLLGLSVFPPLAALRRRRREGAR
ncbi:MAG: PEP-CTERM sorting domain-containing protein [Pirellulales bacterium]